MAWQALAGAALGGGNIVSDILVNAYNVRESRKAQRRAIAFAREVLQNRYQYTMADMEKAGLNPMLAYQQGTSGAMGSAPGASFPSGPSDMIGRGVSTAKQAMAMKDSLKILKNQVQESWARAGREGAEWTKAEDEALLAREMKDKVKAETKRTDVNRRLEETGMHSAKEMEKVDKTEWGEKLRQFQRIMDAFWGTAGRNSQNRPR